jgi:SAM-dependent methyltransferase
MAENTSSQEIDLVTWIFDRLDVRPGSRVLELCCGTGGETLKMLDLLGESGSLVALDVSGEALASLKSKVASDKASRLTLVEGNLNDISGPLEQAGLQGQCFDLIFCAYGLYYSADAERTLTETRSWLKSGGRIAVVGPFGPNNKPLFEMLRASGVTIAKPVIASSEYFMTQTVLAWGARNFESVSVHTMVNPVPWPTPERALNYWQNTTFYDAEKRSAFESLLRRHFEEHAQFVNQKWVMLAEMSHARN